MTDKNPTSSEKTVVEPKPKARKPGVYVVKGHALVCKAGIVDDERDEPLEDKHFAGGKDTLERLVKEGHLERVR